MIQNVEFDEITTDESSFESSASENSFENEKETDESEGEENEEEDDEGDEEAIESGTRKRKRVNWTFIQVLVIDATYKLIF